MNGSSALRGFYAQTLCALFELLYRTGDWYELEMEPVKANPVDLIWTTPTGLIAQQVKSSQNQFRLTDVCRWAAELQQSRKADQYELLLVGPVSQGVINAKLIGEVLIRRPLANDIPSLEDRVEYGIAQYIETAGLRAISASACNRVMKAMTAELMRIAIAHQQLIPENFKALLHLHVPALPEEECRDFAPILREAMLEINKRIKSLTEEQFSVIKELRGSRRVIVQGCAGSGKTLVCAEKAIRLSDAGLEVLVLCHSPFLAKHVTRLLRESGAVVQSFGAWVRELCGFDPGEEDWSMYSQPTDDELHQAKSVASNSTLRYDAVLVDEGQDFESNWWSVVKSALLSCEYSLMYVFSDDNQSLLKHHNSPPIKKVVSLSRNCRNAGRIFERVRLFHPDGPRLSRLLDKLGTYREISYRGANPIPKLKKALADADELVGLDHLVVLTTEDCSSKQSILNRHKVRSEFDVTWQDLVHLAMSEISEIGPPWMSKPKRFQGLSDSQSPTLEDKRKVTAYVKSYLKKLRGKVKYKRRREVKWDLDRGGASLKLIIGEDRKTGIVKPNPWDLAKFFSNLNWVNSIPQRRARILLSCRDQTDNNQAAIPLFTVQEFKGLESDAIILLAMATSANIHESLYVGLSRARAYLDLVVSTKCKFSVPQLRPRTESKRARDC